MENQLDKIAKGEINWCELCAICMQDIGKGSEKLKDEKKLEIQIDATHSYIIGKFGPVIKCIEGLDKDKKEIISFKGVKPNIDLRMLEAGEYKVEDIIEEVPKKVDVIGKFHGEDLFIKRGKYGIYAQWGDQKKSLSCFGNRPIENINYEEVLKILMKSEDTDQPNFSSNIIREITSNISIRKGSYGDYLFFKTSKMKKPTFYKLNGFKGDYKNCHIDILKNWIVDEYKIRI
jgi:topoisomerase IA-like protein